MLVGIILLTLILLVAMSCNDDKTKCTCTIYYQNYSANQYSEVIYTGKTIKWCDRRGKEFTFLYEHLNDTAGVDNVHWLISDCKTK